MKNQVLVVLPVERLDALIKACNKNTTVVKLPIPVTLPQNAFLMGINLDRRTDTIILKYYHEEFQEVMEGGIPPVLQTGNRVYSITEVDDGVGKIEGRSGE